MKFNINDIYQIESDASQKKIYRFNNQNLEKIIVDFSYNHDDYLSYLDINNFLSMLKIVPVSSEKMRLSSKANGDDIA